MNEFIQKQSFQEQAVKQIEEHFCIHENCWSKGILC